MIKNKYEKAGGGVYLLNNILWYGMIEGVYKNVETDLDKKLLKTEFSIATAVFIRVTKICCSRVIC